MPFITVDSTQWHPFLAGRLFDLYHLPGYCVLDAETIGGEALGWTFTLNNRSHLIPVIRRPISPEHHADDEEPLYDLISPYGYPGMLSTDKLSPAEALQVFSHFNAEAEQAGYVSSFIRLNPFLNNWSLPASDTIQQFCHGITLTVDLKIPCLAGSSYHAGIPGYQLYDFSHNHRRNLDRLHHGGYSVVVNAHEYLPHFAKAYIETMIRHQAHRRYFFSEDYFRRLCSLADNHIHFLSVLSPGGEFTCGGLFSVFGPAMQYLFGATTESAMHQSPSKLMIEEAMNLGIGCGAEFLHLGGGAGAKSNDGVFRFKLGFTHNQQPFHCLHFIHRPHTYQWLEQEANGKKTDTPAEGQCISKVGEVVASYGDHTGFFPSYRAYHE